MLKPPCQEKFDITTRSDSIYRFHYDVIKVRYPGAQLLFTDTDSLYYYIQTWDLEVELLKDRNLFDYSDYDKTSVYFDESNKKIIGKFKCETKGAPIVEFVGLRPKMYSILYKLKPELESRTSEKHRIKGISRTAAKGLTHEHYKAQLDCPTENYITNRRIGFKLHRIFGIEVEKRGLCGFDDKRCILDDGINSLAYGHKDITGPVIWNQITNPGGDIFMSKCEARNKGLIWSRRKGADNRLEFKDKLPIENQAEKESRQKLKRKLSEAKNDLAKFKRLQTANSQVDTELASDDNDTFSDSDI